jgi:SAM-dependent methyltransferase
MSSVEQRRFRKWVQTFPIGFANNMVPKSIEHIFQRIGYENIFGARVLEVGCGQGFLMAQLLYARARDVIGTECDLSTLNSIPQKAFDVYRARGQSVTCMYQPFEETPYNIEVEIITMFIGSPKLVYRLLELFVLNDHVRIIAFMKPISGRNELNAYIFELAQTHALTSTQFAIKLSGSGEQRQAMVMKKV